MSIETKNSPLNFTPEYDNFFEGTKIDVMPTPKMAMEALFEQKDKIAAAVLIAGSGVFVLADPAHAERLIKNVHEAVQGFNINTEVKSFVIGSGIGVFKEFIESPKQFISAARLKDGHKLMEIIGNAVCAGIVGLTVSDYRVLITNEENIVLTPAAQKQLVVETLAAIPSIFAVILTTDKIKKWVTKTPGAITDTVANTVTGIKKSHDFQNDVLKLERAIKHANTYTQSKSDEYNRKAAIEVLAKEFGLPVYRVNKRGETTGVNRHYIQDLSKQMGPDKRLSLEEAQKILNG